ncbi:unnamed protein product [Effrenium voratum]|nr:unnamed protein product [Effrenium voratum]
MGMVSNTGNGRRYAAQALLRELLTADGVELAAVLVYDSKNETGRWALPLEGPQRLSLSTRHGPPVTAWRGSMGQLLGACCGELFVDLAISIQARRTCLELMLRSIQATKYVVMGHDYNLPFGPWGMEVEPDMLALHKSFIQDPRVTMFCTSQHLQHYVERFSDGKVKTRLCYCADYGYFDGPNFPPEKCEGKYVTFISPSPAKGLAIVLRLALMFPDTEFLCVSTVWTKSLHEVQLRAHPNIRVVPGSDDIDEVYRQTAVLVMPSLWSESFGLVAVEAQLRGLCVVSSDSCGLQEANFLEELRVPVSLVHDSRTREMLRGISLSAAELSLDPLRKCRTGQQHIHDAHCLIASEAEASGFAGCLRRLADPSERRRLGQLARERALQHVHSRRGAFTRSLQALLEEPDAADAAGDGAREKWELCDGLPNVAPQARPAQEVSEVWVNGLAPELEGVLRLRGARVAMGSMCPEPRKILSGRDGVMADYDVSSMPGTLGSTRYSMDPGERMRTGNRGYWLATVKFPRPLCRELGSHSF